MAGVRALLDAMTRTLRTRALQRVELAHELRAIAFAKATQMCTDQRLIPKKVGPVPRTKPRPPVSIRTKARAFGDLGEGGGSDSDRIERQITSIREWW